MNTVDLNIHVSLTLLLYVCKYSDGELNGEKNTSTIRHLLTTKKGGDAYSHFFWYRSQGAIVCLISIDLKVELCVLIFSAHTRKQTQLTKKCIRQAFLQCVLLTAYLDIAERHTHTHTRTKLVMILFNVSSFVGFYCVRGSISFDLHRYRI